MPVLGPEARQPSLKKNPYRPISLSEREPFRLSNADAAPSSSLSRTGGTALAGARHGHHTVAGRRSGRNAHRDTGFGGTSGRQPRGDQSGSSGECRRNVWTG